MEKVDLHIHTTNKRGNDLKEYIRGVLKSANDKSLSAVSIFDRNSVDMYQPGEVFYDLVKRGEVEKIAPHLKIIPGTEMSCTISGASASPNFDFNNYTSHIGIYGFDPSKIVNAPMLCPSEKENRKIADAENLLRMCHSFGIEIPEINPNKDLAQQIFDFLRDNSSQNEMLKNLLDAYPNKSELSRNFLENPRSEMFYARLENPTVIECLETAHEYNAQRVLMHQFYMNTEFNGIEYANAIYNIPTKYGTNQIDGIETQYFNNTAEETMLSENFAKEYGLFQTSGSDTHPWINNDDPSSPQMGAYNSKNNFADLTMQDEIIDKLPDVREYL